MSDVSLITTCKGRLDHLAETIGSMTDQRGVDYEVVLVDYGDPESAWRFMVLDVDFYHRAAVRVIDDTCTFNLGRARNFGVKWAEGDILAFVDADVFLSTKWLHSVVDQIRGGCELVTRGGNIGGITGTFAVTRKLYDKVRGFDESIKGWGYEEVDFFKRCQRAGKGCTYDAKLVRAITHTDELRTAYYEDKDKRESNARNMKAAAHVDRLVNPDGYALGKAMYYRNPHTPYIA